MNVLCSGYWSTMETAVGDVQSISSLSDVSERRSTSSTALNEETCVVASGECRPGPRLDGRPAARKEDQQARYWSYLFDNLHRVVDEIYCTCEADQSVIECEVRTYVRVCWTHSTGHAHVLVRCGGVPVSPCVCVLLLVLYTSTDLKAIIHDHCSV